MKKLAYLAFLIAFFLCFQPAFANSSFTPQQNNFFIQTYPAKTISEIILVKSNSSGLQTIRANWQGFQLDKSSSVSSSAVTQHSIDFATLDQSQIELQPKATALITVTFKTPALLKAGDYYGSLLLTRGEEKEEVSFTIRILGTVTEKVSLESISKEDRNLNLKVANKGSQTIPVFAEVKVNDIAGLIESVKTEVVNVRAGEITTLKVKHKVLLPGFYQAQIALVYGEKETRSTSLYYFWVSTWFIAALFAVLILIAAFLGRRRLRRGRKHV